MRIGIGTAVFVTFLALKLTAVIDWSWWWVTAPLWIPAGIVVVAAGLLSLVCIAPASEAKKQSK